MGNKNYFYEKNIKMEWCSKSINSYFMSSLKAKMSLKPTSSTFKCLLIGLNPPNWGCGKEGNICLDWDWGWEEEEEGLSWNTVEGGSGLWTGKPKIENKRYALKEHNNRTYLVIFAIEMDWAGYRISHRQWTSWDCFYFGIVSGSFLLQRRQSLLPVAALAVLGSC